LHKFWIVISIFIVACSPQEIQQNIPLIIGHGGDGFHTYNQETIPNTELSILSALQNPDCDGIEVDIQRTQDEKLILFHDEYLESSTNASGSLESWKSEDLKAVQYKPDFFGNAPEILFADAFKEIVKAFPEKHYFLNVRTRKRETDQSLQDYAAALMEFAKDLSIRIYLETPDTLLLLELQKQNWPHKLLWNGAFTSGHLSWVEEQGLDGMVVKLAEISPELRNEAKDKGLFVGAFNLIIRQNMKDALPLNLDAWQVENLSVSADFRQ
jgi:glycerophosphoryl diester phosphodiesterase